MRAHLLTVPLVFALSALLGACQCGRPDVGEDGGADGSSSNGDGGTGADGGTGGDGGGSDAGSGTDAGVDAGPCTGPVTCYTGPSGTLGVGPCQAGIAQCVDGGLGPCVGQVLPAAEVCNNVDDDCNGQVDDGLGNISCGVGICQATVYSCHQGRPATCTPGDAGPVEICGNGLDDNCNGSVDEGCNCMYVAPNGNDSNSGQALSPLLTITAGIAKAKADGGMTVCVASGAIAPSSAIYSEDIAMADGVSVLGGYVTGAGVNWTRPGLAGGATTRIAPVSAQGVLFDGTITARTALDGFVVQASNAASNAAITVTGSTGAVINGNQISGGGGTNSVGVDVVDLGGTSATPTLTSNGIGGGSGSALAVGVRSRNSSPLISSNCGTFDSNGRCTSFGCGGGTLFIKGSTAGGGGNASTQSFGVLLDSSPGAVVQGNAVCSGASSGDSAGVLVQGPAAGTSVRLNNISSVQAAQNSVGAWFRPCGAAAPDLFNNFYVAGLSNTVGCLGDGVRAVGDCHVRVDSNVTIVGGQELAKENSRGVACLKDVDSGVSSQCVVSGNETIRGSGAGFPPTSTGVHCDDGACALIENNKLITGQQGVTSIGVSLGATGTLVNNNGILAGCASGTGIGLRATNSFARVQNNVIHGGQATPNCVNAAQNQYGALVTIANGPNELDLDSNDIFGDGSGGCTSRGVTLDVNPGIVPPSGPRGLVRSNIIHGGSCATSYSFEEATAMGDPKVVENNDLWGTANLTALYRDEGTTNLTTITQVNALTDKTVALNISADPLFVSASDYHLTSSSPCKDTGADAGCPATDFDGDARPRGPACDIGADEF